jgi:SprT protein
MTHNVFKDWKLEVLEEVERTYAKAEKVYGRTFPRPNVVFKNHGRTAGYAYYDKNEIHISCEYLWSEPHEMVKQTTPHECAHLINRYRNGEDVSPHGKGWKAVMVALGQKPIRCQRFPLTQKHQRK